VDEWGVGRYEDTAAELAPASEVAVAALGLKGGERVLDVRPEQLLEHRRIAPVDRRGTLSWANEGKRLSHQRHRGEQRAPGRPGGDRDAPRNPDHARDLARHPVARSREDHAEDGDRRVEPGVGEGQVGGIAVHERATGHACAGDVQEPRRAVEPGDLGPGVGRRERSVAGPAGNGKLQIRERQLGHQDATPEKVWTRWERWHPMWIGAREVLEPAGEWDRLREASLAALREGGLGSGATSPYLLAVLERR
jgi:hypothetical protein